MHNANGEMIENKTKISTINFITKTLKRVIIVKKTMQRKFSFYSPF